MDAEKIYQQYFDKIYKYCYFKTQRDKYITEELVSKVFFLLYQKWDQLNNRSDLEILKWLYCTANLIIKEYNRSIKYVVSISEEYTALLQDQKDAEYQTNQVLEEETYQYYINAIKKRLKEKDKQLFDDIVVKRISYSSIAQKMCIDQRAVQMRWIRLQKKIRKFIHEIIEL